MPSFPITPKTVSPVSTKYRTIKTQLPVPESLPILEEMRKYEPQSMSGLPPIVWKNGENFTVHDHWGNRWIDCRAASSSPTPATDARRSSTPS